MDRDLNKALADAMSALPDEGSYGTASVAETPQPERVEQWITGQPRQLRQTRIGIDYSSQHLALAELAPASKGWDIQALRSEDFAMPLDARALAAVLREFQSEPGIHVRLSVTSSRAVVRQFTIPPVPKRRRLAAATWEAKKLIPFPLREQDAVFGFKFTRDVRVGWSVTLAAVPREDASPILDAIQALGWTLEGVSVSGTQVLECSRMDAAKDSGDVVAQVCWSRHRASFAVHHKDRIVFHYDMGNLAGVETLPGHAVSPEQVRAWLNSLEKGIAEALEFFLGSTTRLALSRLEICGLTEAAAPLVTNWSERFDLPVVIHGPARQLGCALSPESETWLDRHDGQFTMALLAAIGTPSVDLTPVSQLRRRNARLHERLTITGGVMSLALMLTVSGYTWVHNQLVNTNLTAEEVRLEAMHNSTANARLHASLQNLTAVRQLNAMLDNQPIRWTEFLKGLLHTFPEEVRLMSLSVSPVSTAPNATAAGAPQIRLEGRLLPTGLSHEIIYAEWVNDMEAIAGLGSVRVASVRELEWKGRQSSLFVIEITPPALTVTGGSL